MKNKNSIIFLFLLSILILSSCVINKPDSSAVSPLDYNGRCQVTSPTYQKRLSVIGTGSIVVSTLGGAYLGYSNNTVTYYSEGEKKNFKAGDVLLGAAIGYSFSYLCNRLGGWGKSKTDFDNEAWLRKANKNYVMLNNGSNSFTAINKSYEKDFSIRSIEDAKDFIKVFPNSYYLEEKIAGSVINTRSFSRDNYQELMALFPNSQSNFEIKKLIISKSNSLNELFTSWEKYNVNLDYETLAYNLVKNTTDAKIFIGKFPKSKYGKDIINKLSSSLSYFELKEIVMLFDYVDNIRDLKQMIIDKSPSIDELKKNLSEYPNVISKSDAVTFGWNIVLKDKSFKTADEFAKAFPENKYVRTFRNSVYIGELSFDRREGYGFLIDAYGYKFRGNWRNDVKDGYGEEWDDKLDYFYKGSFEYGEYSGQGEQKRGRRDFYVGSFKKGEREGSGTLTYDDGKAVCKGNFTEGYMKGVGRIDFSNGEWYEGDFDNGLPDGRGTYRTIDGKRITGSYKQGVRVGRHTYRKFVLGGLVDTEKGEVDFGQGGDGDALIVKTYDIFDKRKEERDDVKEESMLKQENKETEIDFEKIDNPDVSEYGEWGDSPHSSAKRQYVKFDDGINGYLFKDEDKDNSFHISTGLDDYYYKTYEATIRALYVLKKHKEIIKRGRK